MLQKPEWLRLWLQNLNWDVFSFHIYVGDAVEEAIDWVLGWLNAFLEWADLMYGYMVDFRDELLELLDSILWFFEDPIEHLKTIFELYVLPWALENIPFFATLYYWYLNLRVELEAFFTNPGGYLRDKFENDIFPWARENIPFFRELEGLLNILTQEVRDFFDDPRGYIRALFEDHILPWLLESFPLFQWLYHLYLNVRETLESFLDNPWKWLEGKFVDWFLGAEE